MVVSRVLDGIYNNDVSDIIDLRGFLIICLYAHESLIKYPDLANAILARPFDRYITLNTGVIGSGNAFFFPLTQSNPNLNVEISKELEIGTDIGLNLGKNSAWLNNLNFSATYWKRSTDNAIFNVDAIPSSGVGTVKDNAFSLS